MTKEVRISKFEAAREGLVAFHWSFGFRYSFDIRHSDFVIIQSPQGRGPGRGDRKCSQSNRPMSKPNTDPSPTRALIGARAGWLHFAACGSPDFSQVRGDTWMPFKLGNSAAMN